MILVNIHNIDKSTVLMKLCTNTQLEDLPILKRILELGVSVNEKNIENLNTALHYALKYPVKETVEQVVTLLLERGASTNIQNKAGQTAYNYMHTYSKNLPESVQYMIKLHKKGSNYLIKLCKSTKFEDLHKVKECLQLKKDEIYKQDKKCKTALHTVIQNPLTESVEELVTVLLEADFNNRLLNVQDKYGNTALHYACILSRSLPCKVVNMLITEDNINLENKDGFTPLMLCCRFSRTSSTEDTVRILIKAGADVNLQNKDNWTALMHSSKCSRTSSTEDTVRILIKAGADVNLQNKDGDTALIIASEISQKESTEETVKILLEQNPLLTHQNNVGRTALIQCCRHSNTTSTEETVKMLLEADTTNNSVNIQDKNGWTALMHSSRYSRTDSTEKTVKMLLGRNPVLNLQQNCGWTALMLSCRYSRTDSTEETVKMLLETDTINNSVNIQDKDGWTALMVSCRYSRTESTEETVKMLLEADTTNNSVNIQDKNGWTALMHSCRYSRTDSTEETVKMLLKTDPVLNLQQNDGRTALMLSCIYSRRDSTEKTVKMLLKADMINKSVNIQDKNGWTALMLSSEHSRTDSSEKTVKMLLRKGVNVNIQDRYKLTALHHACKSVLTTSTSETVKILLDRGRPLSINDQKFNGDTPLMSLINQNVDEDTVEYMLKNKDHLLHQEANRLYNVYPKLYMKFYRDVEVKKFVQQLNKTKLIKFIPLRKQQIECYPTSYKVQLKGLLFDINNGKQLMSQLFDSLDKKMKDYFNIKTVDDLIKIDQLI